MGFCASQYLSVSKELLELGSAGDGFYPLLADYRGCRWGLALFQNWKCLSNQCKDVITSIESVAYVLLGLSGGICDLVSPVFGCRLIYVSFLSLYIHTVDSLMPNA